MRPILWGLLVFVLCLPLAFVLLLVAAARYPSMDAFTMKLPMDFRTAVAELTLRNAGYGKDSAKGIDRAIKFDPESADAWTRRCHGNVDETTYDQAACRKAITLEPTASNFNGLGMAQEQAKDYCAAEDSYTSAIRETADSAILFAQYGASGVALRSCGRKRRRLRGGRGSRCKGRCRS